jgi:putative toxin-antitoxin system antitoxin component (TIGR02293 family)
MDPLLLEAPMNQSCQISLGADDAHNLIALCKAGFDAKTFDDVAGCLKVPEVRLAEIIRIPKTTLSRRKRDGRFSYEESERLYRIVRLYNLATDVLGTPDNAREWLNAASGDFQGQTPLDYAESEIGAREVEAVLDRISDGVVF